MTCCLACILFFLTDTDASKVQQKAETCKVNVKRNPVLHSLLIWSVDVGLVGALKRHRVGHDVFRKRRRCRLEWELAIFPIF